MKNDITKNNESWYTEHEGYYLSLETRFGIKIPRNLFSHNGLEKVYCIDKKEWTL
jgi:hypothetical protein